MALSQIQIIQSLAECLTWFEKELEWGVPPAEMSHLTGRIGELFAAMITRGQMAQETNQKGYDVISSENERISVKTITSTTNIAFNSSTFALVDRIMILRINIDEDEGISVETLLDCSSEEFLRERETSSGTYRYYVSKGDRVRMPLENLRISYAVSYGSYDVSQYENGSICVRIKGKLQSVAKPHLRKIAADIGVDILNSNERRKNTRQLGADIIRMLIAKNDG